MSDDTEKLQQAVYALRESIDIIERATIVVGAVDPDGLESLLQEAFTRFLYRAGRYDLEPSADAEREAVRAAVEPLARRVLGVETSVEDLWQDYRGELMNRSPEAAFRKVVTRVVAAVGPARRQRQALQQITEVLNTPEDGLRVGPSIWKILLEVGAEPLAEPLQSATLVKDAPSAEPAAGAIAHSLVPCGGPAGANGAKRCVKCDRTGSDLEFREAPLCPQAASTPERTFPRVTLSSVTPGSLIEIASGDLGLVLEVPTAKSQRWIAWIATGHTGTMPAGATVSLRATPGELDALTSADASRPGLTEEQAQIARAEPAIAAWLDYFAAMDRQHKSGTAADARIVRDLRAKANGMDRFVADVVYHVALARHRASRGETGQ